MRRRDIIVLLGGTALMAPRIGIAQQAASVQRIAFFSIAAGPNYLADAFIRGLRDLGYVEGQNLSVEYRWMAGREDHYGDVARELSRGDVEVIVTAGHPAALAVKAATSQIPIVALAVVDPVGAGLASSLAHPGGNLTGLSLEVTPETNTKMLQVLHEAVPELARCGVLRNSANPGSSVYLNAMRETAQLLRVSLEAYDVHGSEDIEAVFRTMQEHVDGLVVFPEPVMWTLRRSIVERAQAAKIPTIFGYRDAALMGALMSYGPDLVDLFTRGASLVDKILHGAKPADLPIEQPTKFELVVNIKTAKTLGHTIPPSLLARADEVIE